MAPFTSPSPEWHRAFAHAPPNGREASADPQLRGEKTVKRIMGLAAIGVAAVAAAVFVAGATAKSSGLTLKGAGSTFVSPLILTFAQPYESATGAHIDYNPIGSGGGIQAIQNRQVDFGASDAPLTTDQFNACNGCVQIPWGLAGTAIDYNIPGLGLPKNTNLRLTGDLVSKMYMGQITSWNDGRIKAINPKATLPDVRITPVYRTGNSGTTYNFTDY